MSCDRFLRFAGMGFLAFSWTAWPVEAAMVEHCDEAALRAALGAGGTVTLTCDGTIALADTLRITQDTVLDGRGHRVTLSGEKRARVLQVDPGVNLTLLDLTIAFGQSTNGGGIYNDGGSVLLVNCVLATNCAVGVSFAGDGSGGLGGAVFNRGFLTMSNSIVRGNQARGGAGSGGTPGVPARDIIDQYGRCRTVSPPSAGGVGSAGGQGLGGGVFNVGTTLVVNSSLEGNEAIGGNGGLGGGGGNGGCTSGCGPAGGGAGGAGGRACGGGIHSSGPLTIVNSTLAGNQTIGGAGGNGGGAMCPFVTSPGRGGNGGVASGGAIWNAGSHRGYNVTLAQNGVRGGDGGYGGGFPLNGVCPAIANGNGGDASGGAVWNEGAMTLLHATVWNNAAAAGSGTNRLATNCSILAGVNGAAQAASIHAAAGTFTLTNSIVGNLASSSNCSGFITDGGHNICSDNTANFSAAGSLNGTDPRLGALADNGGPTLTVALHPNSPAIDAADTAACLAQDQRGGLRPSGVACDIGAFEGTNGIYGLGLQLSVVSASFPTGQIVVLRAVLSNPNIQSASNASLVLSIPGMSVTGWNSMCGGAELPSPAGQFRVTGLNVAPGDCTLEFSVVGNQPGPGTLLASAASELTGLSTVSATLGVVLTARPTVVSGTAANILLYTARLNGTVSPNGLPSDAWFEWGTTIDYGQETSSQGVSAPGTTVSDALGGLIPGTTYHFRQVAQNANGLSYGEDRSFATLSGIPEVTTGLASEETRTGARLSGTTSTRGLPGTAFFEYGPTTNYGQRTPPINLPDALRFTQIESALAALEPGAVYHYRVVGASNLGTNHGTDDIFGTLGDAGHALRFSGLGGAIHGNTRFTNPTVFTLTLWFRTTSKGGTLATFTVNPFVSFDPQDDRHLYLSSAGEIYFGVNGGGTWTIHGSPGYNDGQWHHAAAVLSSNGMKLYLDGSLVAADTGRTNAHNHAGQWRLGFGYLTGWPSATGQPYFSGQLDEIHCWEIERSAGQIQHEMNWFPAGSEPGLVFYWACNEGAGNLLNDSSGHGRTANWFGSFPDLRWMASTIPTRRLTGITLGPWGLVHLAFPGAPSSPYALETSSDLRVWQRVATNTAGMDNVVQFQKGTVAPRQFFRAVSP